MMKKKLITGISLFLLPLFCSGADRIYPVTIDGQATVSEKMETALIASNTKKQLLKEKMKF